MRLITVLFALLWAASLSAAELAEGRLTVSADGRIASAPDMATITMGVLHEAATAAAALEATSGATRAVLDQLAQDGVAPRDMQTRDLALNPVWSNRNSSGNTPPRIVGFQASNTVVVRVRNLDALGGILDRVVSSGANNFQGLSFGLQDPGPVQDAARRNAVAEAQRKATLYADAAGLRLGAVLRLDENGGAPVTYGLSMVAEPVPVAQGEVTTAASVTMVFEIAGPAQP